MVPAETYVALASELSADVVNVVLAPTGSVAVLMIYPLAIAPHGERNGYAGSAVARRNPRAYFPGHVNDGF